MQKKTYILRVILNRFFCNFKDSFDGWVINAINDAGRNNYQKISCRYILCGKIKICTKSQTQEKILANQTIGFF